MSFEKLFRSSPSPLLLLDMETWRPLEFNDSAAAMMGYSREEFSKLTITDFELNPNPTETRQHISDIRNKRRDCFTALHKKRLGQEIRVRVDLNVVNWFGSEAMMTAWNELDPDVYQQRQASRRNQADEPKIIANSEAMKRVLRMAGRIAKTELPVLVLGESGTGKELVARQIHWQSERAGKVFMPINCAAIPADIVDGELFGFERGAFTGADRTHKGRFEVAKGGTVFLDEVGDLSLPIQARLLRTLQNGEIHRLGSDKPHSVDFRVVAATNRNLSNMVENGTFREDLYYRINGAEIKIPPLRERVEDIRGLALLEIDQSSVEFTPADFKFLESLPLKGNARELLSLVHRAIALSEDGRPFFDSMIEPMSRSSSLAGSVVLDDVIREHLVATLDASNWKIGGSGGAASQLGIHPSTLRSKMVKLGVHRS